MMGAIAITAIAARPASADRYEATISVRPAGALARIDDAGVETPATVAGGGAAAGLWYGLRNWLDIGGEVVGIVTPRARYARATLPVEGNPQTGELSRTTRLAQLRAGATLRLGVAWVPTVHVSLGIGGRLRSAAALDVNGVELAPDDQGGELAIDIVATVRAGLERRLNRRWTIGISAGASACLGLGAPDTQIIDAGIGLAYSWYPLW